MNNDMFKIQNFEQLTQHIAILKNDVSTLISVLYSLLDIYPFCFGYFKQLITLLSVEDALDLIQLQINRCGYCRQTWEVYLDYAALHPEIFDQETLIQLLTAALERIGTDFGAAQLWKKLLKSDMQRQQNQRFNFPLSECGELKPLIGGEEYDRLSEVSARALPFLDAVAKRDFFHFKPLKNAAQIAELICQLTDTEQLMRLYAVAYVDEALRYRIVLKIVQAFMKRSNVAKEKLESDENAINFLKQHLQSAKTNQPDTVNAWIDSFVNISLNNVSQIMTDSEEYYQTIKIAIMNSESSKQLLQIVKCLKYLHIQNQFEYNILNKITHKMQSEAMILAELYENDVQKLRHHIKQFNYVKCDYLVHQLVKIDHQAVEFMAWSNYMGEFFE